MADGYGFGAEGDWKTAVLVRAAKVMGAGLPGGASLMEDYTYDLTPGDELILGAHMLEVCPSLIAAPAHGWRSTRSAIGGREDPVRLVFTRRPGPGRRRRAVRHARPVPAGGQRGRGGTAGRAAAAAAGRPRGLAAAPRTSRRRRRPGCTAGAAHHTVMSTAVGIEAFEDFARMAGTELLVIDEHDHACAAFENELRWNAAYYRLARGI